jgi:hypothetical protein
MYKRPARVLFLSVSGPALATRIAEQATAGYPDFLEARAAGAEGGPTRDELDWADLLVTLDDAARRRVVSSAPDKPSRAWNLFAADEATWPDQVERELSSMAGGMRMLARLDAKAGD